MTEMAGGCACGAVRFKTTASPIGVGVCHCLDCQKSSGGGPNYVALIPKGAVEVTKGEAKVYISQGDSGAEIGRAFCADCGSPLWSVPGGEAPFVPVKLGAFDDPSGFAPNLHLYTDSAQPWHLMHDGLPRFPKMPPGPPPAP
jgi:hypothetical protein